MQQVVAEISLGRIRKNARLLVKKANTALYAVVKDDGYGHGAEQVAHALDDIASGFCTATVKEGAALRIAGIRAPVLVFAPPLDREDALRLRAYDLTATVSSPRSLLLAAEAGVPFHLAVNTGMNRYGVAPADAGRMARRARALGACLTGVCSHLWAPQDETVRNSQLALFQRAAEEVRVVFPDAVRHLAATGGILAGREYCFDAVRPGIGLYGYAPAGFEGALPFSPAARIWAPVSHTCARVGDGAGYCRAGEERRFHTLRLGYGDGFFRTGGLCGETLCMDACVRGGEARVGAQKLILCNVTRYARAHGTTEYEALLRVLQGAEKRYG